MTRESEAKLFGPIIHVGGGLFLSFGKHEKIIIKGNIGKRR